LGTAVKKNEYRVHSFSHLTTLALADARYSHRPACSAAPLPASFDFWVGDWNVTQNGKPAGTTESTGFSAAAHS